MPVGGSRHYQGAGLGIGAWNCPACNAENAGPLEQGCVACGSGGGAKRADAMPPPPLPIAQEQTPDAAQIWIQHHPNATLYEAFTAGYVEGVRDNQRKLIAQRPPVQLIQPEYTKEGKVARTIIAALELFRDQVLVARPEEVASGEWCSAEEASLVVRRLRLEQEQQEAAHV